MSNTDRERLQEAEDHRLAAAAILDDLEGQQPPIPPAVPVIPRSSEDSSVIASRHSDAMRAMEHHIRTGAIPESDVLQLGVDTLGGLLAPPEIAGPIAARMAAASVMQRLVAGASTNRDVYTRPRVIPASGDDGSIFTSAFQGDWVAEIPVASAGEAEPTFGNVVVPIRNVRAKCTLSRNLASDAEFDVMDFLVQDGGRNLGLVVDKGLIAGTGVGPQPLGLFRDTDIPTVDIEGDVADTISNSTSDAGSAAKLLSLIGALPAQYHEGASFLMNPATLTSIRKLVAPSGDYLLDWNSGSPPTLFDYPIAVSPFVAVEADGAEIIAFGNFEEAYLAVRREGITVQADVTSKADVESIVLYVRTRIGGATLNPDAMRLGVIPTS